MKKSRLLLFLTALLLGTFAARAQVVNQDTFTVAQDGTGDYTTIAQVIEAIRPFRPTPTTVYIKNGVYREKVAIPSWVCDVTFIGEDPGKTVISWDDYAGRDNLGTFRSYTLLAQGNDLRFENLTIENTAGEVGQAVAAHIEGDRVTFRNCRILGHQDTVYAGREGARIYFEGCTVAGTTDFIFGPSTCWFERCELHCLRDSYITAASTPPSQPFGYVFNECRITVDERVTSMYLGRPWRAWAMTLFMHCELPAQIAPAGWHNWGNPANESTARYMEYKNQGPGAQTAHRTPWAHILTDEEARQYTLENAMKGCDGWIPDRRENW